MIELQEISTYRRAISWKYRYLSVWAEPIQEGDYFLPDLLPPESISIGIWARRRKHCPKTKREPVYTALRLSGKPENHLSKVDAQTAEMFSQFQHGDLQCALVHRQQRFFLFCRWADLAFTLSYLGHPK